MDRPLYCQRYKLTYRQFAESVACDAATVSSLNGGDLELVDGQLVAAFNNRSKPIEDVHTLVAQAEKAAVKQNEKFASASG